MEKIRNNLWSIVFFALVGLLAVVIAALIASVQRDTPDDDIIVGGVFIGSNDDSGWNELQYEGLKEACGELDASLECVFNVAETQKACKKAVERLADKGCKVVFLTSGGFGNEVYSVVRAYPEILFYTIAPEAEANNSITYFGRMYQARYLSGILAGEKTKTNTLGFVAAMDTPQVNRGINAFLLGARTANPKVKVKVRYIGVWSDENAEVEAADHLINDENADVIVSHTSTSVAVDFAEAHGVYSIGWNIEEKKRSKRYLGTVVVNWHKLFSGILKDVIKGDVSETGIYWWGLTEEAVDFHANDQIINRHIKNTLSAKQNSFKNGMDVFVGEIRSNDHEIKCRKDERLSDESLLFDMDWLVEGVSVCGNK